MEKTDQNLITEYLNGDEKSLEHLIERYLKPAYSFAYRFTGNTEDAEDITQDVFVKIWKNIKKYKTDQNFKTWLFTIAKNTIIDWMRKKKNLTFSDFENDAGENSILETLADPEPLVEEIVAKAHEGKIFEKLLTKLSPLYRTVIILRYQNDFSFEEIGHILGKPLDTVKSQHRRALILLRNLTNDAAPKSALYPY